MNTEQNLKLFREMLSCMSGVYCWVYDPALRLIDTDCPEPETGEILFEAVSSSVPLDADKPALISSELGFSWVADSEKDEEGNTRRLHVIGPALTSRISMDLVRKAVTRKYGVSYTRIKNVEEMVSRIPSVPMSRLIEYSLMLHYCLTEQKLGPYDVLMPETAVTEARQSSGHTENPYPTWLMEQKLYKLVEDGNLNFREEMSRITSGAVPADLGGGDALRHYKNMMIIFTAGCARAAIRGGLSPGISYDLSDKYIQDLEKCRTIPEIIELNAVIQEDYTLRVHRIRSGSVSPQIQRACEYVQNHVEEKLDLRTVSSAVGYSPSWLSGKFRRETGKTLTDYIAERKTERAKDLLRAGETPVQEIAEQLHYSTASHFASVFRKQTGLTPREYRLGADLRKK